MTVKEKICSFNSLYKAMKDCKRNVSWKDSVQGYYKNSLVNIHTLRKSLLRGTYTIDKYTSFTVYEPKERPILATRFKDRVFQHSMCVNYLYGELTRSFIYDNCACQHDKGTEFARRRTAVHLHKHYRKHGNRGYILKIDIKDYFGSTPHATAKAAVTKRVGDEWVKEQVFRIIDSYGGDKGMGLGSEVNQLIQLAVLDDTDHMIKERLRIKHYIRYMDDMILIHESKAHLRYCLTEIEKQLGTLGLKINSKKTQIFPVKQGVKFLGYKFRLTESGKVLLTLLRPKIIKERHKLRRLIERCRRGRMTREQVDSCFDSFIAYLRNTPKHAKRACCKLRESFKEYYCRLWEQKGGG